MDVLKAVLRIADSNKKTVSMSYFLWGKPFIVHNYEVGGELGAVTTGENSF